MAYCRNGAGPDKDEIRTLPQEARDLILQWDSLLLQNDLLYHKYCHPDGATKHLQLVLPGKLRRQYVERLHADLGHFGETKTCEALARRAYFPRWRQIVKMVVCTCTVSNKSQRGRQALKQTPLRPMREFRPMAVLHADLVAPIPAGSNCKG